MQTVNFKCGHCHNLMAVTENHLGQQVRCPHCQQVVLAPAPNAAAAPAPPLPPPPEPVLAAPGPVEEESIFTPPEESSDDVFGASPVPRIEVPVETPAWMQPPQPAAPPAWGLTPPTPSPIAPWIQPPEPPALPPEASNLEPTITVPVTPAVPAPADTAQALPPPVLAAENTAFSVDASPGWAPAAEPAPAEESAHEPLVTAATRPSVYQPSRGGGWFISLLIIPLISYSILSTIAVIILYTRQQAQPHPLEMLPDNEGEQGGVRKGNRPETRLQYRVSADSPLPPKLRVPLGRTLRVGQIEVTPQRVELRRVVFRVQGSAKPEAATEESLVLQLRLRNVSQDERFYPTDPVFDRRWRGRQGGPYTFLEMGDRKFYGAANTTGQGNQRRETVEGQNFDRELDPGEEMTTIVCTDPDEHVAAALAKHSGPLLWRVHVRRGLVSYMDREISTTAVVGVEFGRSDIQQGG